MKERSLALFEEHRQLLFSIAYRMLGTVMDAQDMVQNTYLRWQESSPDDVQSPRSWLTTVITRLCINHLQLARVQRETYVGTWLPEPLVEEPGASPVENAQLSDSLSLAFLLLLETLTPTERAVFILREGFDRDFAEIAGIVDKSEANCRQILTRARKRIAERRPRFDANTSSDAAEKLVTPFLHAVRAGDLEALLTTMAQDIVLVSDGGGKARALPRPLHGAEPVAKLLINVTRQYGSKTEDIHFAFVNGLPGFVSFDGETPRRVMAFGLQDGRINALFVITNPDKLRHLKPPQRKS
jgi:RNA polymerase sigma-70 factor (ECF subfamily)